MSTDVWPKFLGKRCQKCTIWHTTVFWPSKKTDAMPLYPTGSRSDHWSWDEISAEILNATSMQCSYQLSQVESGAEIPKVEVCCGCIWCCQYHANKASVWMCVWHERRLLAKVTLVALEILNVIEHVMHLAVYMFILQKKSTGWCRSWWTTLNQCVMTQPVNNNSETTIEHESLNWYSHQSPEVIFF